MHVGVAGRGAPLAAPSRRAPDDLLGCIRNICGRIDKGWVLATEFEKRAALLLRDLAKLSYREIGVAMESTPEKASRLVASARREFGSIYRDISI